MSNFITKVFESVWDATNNLIKVGISAGTNLMGKVSIDQTTDGTTNKVQAVNATLEKKEKPFRGMAYFSRPADATPYTALDAITNSTSAPTVMTIDLSSFGVVAGDFIAITNFRIITSTKLSGASINAYIKPATFTATNDNSELSLSDAEAQLGGIVIPCVNLFTTALNSRIASDCGLWLMQIPTGTSIFVELQAGIGFTPGNAERYDIFVEGIILK
jgi:hypothetical protein